MRKRGTIVAVVALLAATAVTGFFERAPIGRALVAAILDCVSGDRVAFSSMRFSEYDAEIDDLRITHAGDPLLDARSVKVRYDLHQVFSNGSRRFGLEALALDHPHLWIVRHADGSLNVSSQGTQQNSPPPVESAPPFVVSLSVLDGEADVLDPARVHAESRRIGLRDIGIVGNLDTGGLTDLDAHATYADVDAQLPIRARMLANAQFGETTYELHAARLPLRVIANSFINTASTGVLAGEGRDIDIRFDVLASPGKTPIAHLAGTIDVSAVSLHVPGLRLPIRDLHGRLDLSDDGLASPRIDGTLAQTPLTAQGGIFNFQAPQFRLGMRTIGELTTLRKVLTLTADRPVIGPVYLGALLEGSVGNPAVLIDVDGAGVAYGSYPFNRVHGTLAYFDQAVDLLGANAAYGPVALHVLGTIPVGEQPALRIALEAKAAAKNLPYADQLIPQSSLLGDAVLSEEPAGFSLCGTVIGSGADRLSGSFALDPQGVGTFGPFVLRRRDGSEAVGALSLDRPRNRSALWFLGSRYMLVPGSAPPLPGLASYAGFPLAGRVDLALVGEGSPSAFSLAGRLSANQATSGSIALGTLTSDIAGNLRSWRLGNLRLDAPWGAVRGEGAYGNARLVLHGRYSGSFERLAALTHVAGARGQLTGPFAMELNSNRILVQTSGAASRGASFRGVPFSGLSGTLAVVGHEVHIYSARGTVADGTAVAAGEMGSGRRLGVAVRGASAAHLSGVGLPLQRGRINAVGALSFSPAFSPSFRGGAALEDGSAFGHALALEGDLEFTGDALRVRQTDVRFDRIVGVADGFLNGIGSEHTDLDMGMRASGIPLSLPAAAMGLNLPLTGSADADVRLSGTLRTPQIAGRVRIPVARVNGLWVHDAEAELGARDQTFTVDEGRATVGSSSSNFAVMRAPAGNRLHVVSGILDLSDFNDFFDRGDLLAGRGHLALDLLGQSSLSHLDATLSEMRVAHFALGDTNAQLQGSGNRLSGNLRFSGAAGDMSAVGNIDLPGRLSRAGLVSQTRYDMRIQGRSLDVARWLVAADKDLPVAGFLDGEGTLTGRSSAFHAIGNAHLADGRVGNIPVTDASLSFTSSLRELKVDRAQAELPSLSLVGSGSLGYAPNDSMAFAVHASSPDVGKLIGRFHPLPVPVTGSLESEIHLTGNPGHPQIIAGFDIEKADVGSVPVPRVLGEFTANGRSLGLRDVEILFAKGDISLAGSLPLTLEPMSVGPPDAPLSLTLQAEGIDLASFTSLLPGDSRLAGLVDGEVSLEGNAGNPSLNGSLGLRNGFFQSPFERTALTNVNVELAMSGKELRVQNLRANAGSGTLASDGTIMLNDLAHPLTKSAYDFKASVRHAELDLPQYGKGVLDADLALHASAGSTPLLSGTATLANATIPFSALALPMGNSPDSLGDEEAISALPNLDLDLNLTAASNVRVRSGNLDLGGTGQIHVAGNLQEPHLEGGFTSTGGTITYFNSSFRVLGGTLKFTPDLGLIPTLDAQAVTTVRNPAATLGDRNVSVDLGVHGPVTDLSVDLQSDPPYPRDQILAFLVGTPTAGVVMSGLNGSTTNSSPSTSVGGELFGLLDAQFTRTLLSPLETKVSGALGLSNIDLALGYGGDVGLTARKLLGRRMQAFYSSGFTYPYRQTFGLEFNATALTVAKLSFYESTTQLAPGSALASTLSATNVSSPAFLDTSTGTNGFAFSLERHF